MLAAITFAATALAHPLTDGDGTPPQPAPVTDENTRRALDLNQDGLELFAKEKWVEAAVAFERALKLMPGNEALRKNLAHAQFKDGVKHLDEKDVEGARSRFRRAIATDDKIDQFHLFLGVAAYQAKDDDEAQAEFRRTLELDPKSAVAHENLGHVLYRNNRLEDAIAEWEKALEIDPKSESAKAALEKARRERDVEGKFLRDRVAHFEIAYDGDRDPLVSTQVLEMLDEAYYRVGSDLSHYPSTPTSVVIYSQQEFSSVTASHGWVGGLFDGKIRVPVKNFARQKAGLARTLMHEYTHVVVASLCSSCPTWLNEGLAQLEEGADVGEADATLRSAAKQGSVRAFSKIPASFASIPDPLEVKILYAQSLSFVRWLHDRNGSYSFHELLVTLARTKDFEKSFQSTFHETIGNLEEEWRQTIE